jgi:hypothetical protein
MKKIIDWIKDLLGIAVKVEIAAEEVLVELNHIATDIKAAEVNIEKAVKKVSTKKVKNDE